MKYPRSWFRKNKKWIKNLPDYTAYLAGMTVAKELAWINKNSKSWDMARYNKELTKILKKAPGDPFLIARQAAIYGDYGQCLGATKEKKFKAVAVKCLRPLLKKLAHQPPFLRSYVRNEYYYHSALYLEQYQLGIERLKAGYNGHFSAGVGAAMHALVLAKKNRKALAIRYGTQALAHWETFEDPKDVGSTFYCLALAFAGQGDRAREAFEYVRRKDKFRLHRAYYESRVKDIELAVRVGGPR